MVLRGAGTPEGDVDFIPNFELAVLDGVLCYQSLTRGQSLVCEIRGCIVIIIVRLFGIGRVVLIKGVVEAGAVREGDEEESVGREGRDFGGEIVEG